MPERKWVNEDGGRTVSKGKDRHHRGDGAGGLSGAAKVLTHFESDHGAAIKVEMRKGQTVTVVNPDFAAQEWCGFAGEIVGTPFLPVCRSQIEVKLKGDVKACDEINARLPLYDRLRRLPARDWLCAEQSWHRLAGPLITSAVGCVASFLAAVLCSQGG